MSESSKNGKDEGFPISIIISFSVTVVYVFGALFTLYVNQNTLCDGDTHFLRWVSLFAIFEFKCAQMQLNEIGDYFAGLFAPLAFAWFAIAFIWQIKELRLQNKEFIRNNETSSAILAETIAKNTAELKLIKQNALAQKAEACRRLAENLIRQSNEISRMYSEKETRIVTILDAKSFWSEFSKEWNRRLDIKFAKDRRTISVLTENARTQFDLFEQNAKQKTTRKQIPISEDIYSSLIKIVIEEVPDN